MNKVSIKQAIVNAIEETDENLMRYELQALRWAKYIEKQIGSLNGYATKAKSFVVEGDQMDVPKNCVGIRRIIYGDYEDQLFALYKDIKGTVLEQDERIENEAVIVKLWAPAEVPYVPDVMWEQRIDVIQFVHELRGRTVTIIYNSLDVDDEGYWIVSENHIKAISDYIKYMYSKKYLWKAMTSDRMLRNTQLQNVELLRRDYSKSIRNARALDAHETEFERKQY